MAGDIYELVNKATQSNSKMGKVQLGYTVDTYKGVLAQLQQISANIGGTGSYDGLEQFSNSLRFDDNGWAISSDACLWEVEAKLCGSVPIKYIDNSKNGIVQVRGDTAEMMVKTGVVPYFPLSMTSDVSAGLDNGYTFPCGVYIDIVNGAWKYMEHFFNSGTSAEGKIDDTVVQKLVENKCLYAQIINPNGGNSSEALVIGKTPNSYSGNNSKILISPLLFATNALSHLGISVTVSGSGIPTQSLLPNNSQKYRSLIENASYDIKKGTIKELNVNNYKNWSKYNAQMTGEADAIYIDQLSNQKYYIRLYIPSHKQAEAREILPSGVNEKLFQTYVGDEGGVTNKDAAINADVNRMLQCIVEVCDQKGLALYKKSMIRDAGGCPEAVGESSGWTTGHGQNIAMAGHFYIPNGWPMCRINQTYGNRSGANQFKRGHPKQGAEGPAVPWVEYSSEERMDTGLNSLDAAALNGNKERVWYQERLRRSNMGNIKIYCSSAISQKWKRIFTNTLAVYAEAAAKYNMGRSEAEQTSAGEIMLRCAPCLCCINGNSPVHRSRDDRKGGHEGGQAIDFAPDLNRATDSYSVNLSTPFAAGMEDAYRPWFHFLYAEGGGWGGSYRFMSRGTKFDSMHFQLG